MKKLVCAMAAICAASGAHAANDKLSFQGYGTVALNYYDSEDGRDYGLNAGVEESWSANENTRFGAQIGYEISDDLKSAAQIRVRSVQESWRADLAWAYLAYDINSDLTVRGGRLRLPIFGESEALDVGYAYPWITPPPEMYQQVIQDGYEGVDLLYDFRLGGQRVNAQLFGGTTALETEFAFRDNAAETDADWIYGVNFGIPTSLADFRISYVKAKVNFSLDDTIAFPTGLPAPAPATVDVEVDIEEEIGHFYSAGFKFDQNDVVVTGEWGKRYIEGEQIADTEAFYLTTGYRIDWTYLPYVTYAQQEDLDANGKQTRIAAGMRWDITPGVAIKGEYSRIKAEDYYGLFAAPGAQLLLPSDGFENEADLATVAVDFVF